MFARLFRSDALAEILGEVEDAVVPLGDSGQLTYNELRDTKTGETVAYFDRNRDVWIRSGVEYSDVVIYVQPA